MTNLTDSTTELPSPRGLPLHLRKINMLASIVEHLTEHRVNEDRTLAGQAHWVAFQIQEDFDNLDKIFLLAGIGLDLSARHLEDDDMLGDELSFLFSEIAKMASAPSKETSAAPH